jgi:phosphatidate cytidylyltransferase
VGKRIVSTIALWLVIFGALWYFRAGGAVALIGLMAALTLREFYQLQAAAGRAPFTWLGMGFGALITISPWLEAHYTWSSAHLLPLGVLLVSLRLLAERQGDLRVNALGSTIFGWVYVGLMLQYLVRIVTPLPGDLISPNGRLILCLWLIATAKFCDTGALLAGMALGKHPMAPTISPKKTWEGAVGGVIISSGVSALVAWLARGQLGSFLTPGRAALIGIPVAIIAIVSDLIESMIKRQAGSKDSGKAIPGIGGIFDLTDSLLLAAPVGFMFLGFR